MTLASKYFKGRLQAISGSTSRGILAAREVNTIQSLYRLSLNKIMQAGEVFLDLGCGDKFLQGEVESLGLLYRGFDINDCNLINEPVPMDDGFADYVVCYSLIEHLGDPDNLLREAFRILKPGGVFLIETPNWHYSNRFFFDDYTHCKPYTPASLRRLCVDYDFEVLGDYPNLRCKADWFYTNRFRYAVAAHLPFAGPKRWFVPTLLVGRAKGMILLSRKPV